MESFMLAYHGGRRPGSPEEGQKHMEDWKAWVGSLGDKVINPGTPLPQSKLVTSSDVTDDVNPNSMNGFAVIKAESIEEAVEIAKNDPFLKMGGTIRVSKMMQMPG